MQHIEVLVTLLKEQMQPNARKPDDENLLDLHEIHRLRLFLMGGHELEIQGGETFRFSEGAIEIVSNSRTRFVPLSSVVAFEVTT